MFRKFQTKVTGLTLPWLDRDPWKSRIEHFDVEIQAFLEAYATNVMYVQKHKNTSNT